MPDRPLPPLFHFTCGDHGYAGIGDIGTLYPASMRDTRMEGFWPAQLVWLTDLARPVREPLGLTQQIRGSCDRTTHRYRVTDDSTVEHWPKVRRARKDAWTLETGEARPIHWYVSLVPVPVVYDPIIRHERGCAAGVAPDVDCQCR